MLVVTSEAAVAATVTINSMPAGIGASNIPLIASTRTLAETVSFLVHLAKLQLLERQHDQPESLVSVPITQMSCWVCH